MKEVNLISIVCLFEGFVADKVDEVLDNINKQTYLGDIELILGFVPETQEADIETAIFKYSERFQFKFVKGVGLELLKECLKKCDGEFVFYKTLGTPQFQPYWYPRHIEVALKDITGKDFYGFSMVEYRNVVHREQPFHTMWWRITDFKSTNPNMFLFDEIWHRNVPDLNVDKLVENGIVSPKRYSILFLNNKMKQAKEVTVIAYTVPEHLNFLLTGNQVQQSPQPLQIPLDENQLLL